MKGSLRSAIEKHGYSVASGSLACSASVLGKVAFDGDTAFHLMAKSSCEKQLVQWIPCGMVGLAVQGASLAGMFVVNAIMLSTFLKALEKSGSTIATVVNCATNFLLSGISGRILFGERLPGLWLCGAAFVVVGVALMVGGAQHEPKQQHGRHLARQIRGVSSPVTKGSPKQE